MRKCKTSRQRKEKRDKGEKEEGEGKKRRRKEEEKERRGEGKKGETFPLSRCFKSSQLELFHPKIPLFLPKSQEN